MHPESIVTTYRPPRAPPRRVRYRPRAEGEYLRETQEWNGCVWRTTGSEIVELVEHDCP